MKRKVITIFLGIMLLNISSVNASGCPAGSYPQAGTTCSYSYQSGNEYYTVKAVMDENGKFTIADQEMNKEVQGKKVLTKYSITDQNFFGAGVCPETLYIYDSSTNINGDKYVVQTKISGDMLIYNSSPNKNPLKFRGGIYKCDAKAPVKNETQKDPAQEIADRITENDNSGLINNTPQNNGSGAQSGTGITSCGNEYINTAICSYNFTTESGKQEKFSITYLNNGLTINTITDGSTKYSIDTATITAQDFLKIGNYNSCPATIYLKQSSKSYGSTYVGQIGKVYDLSGIDPDGKISLTLDKDTTSITCSAKAPAIVNSGTGNDSLNPSDWGDEVDTCEELIGPNVMEFIKSARNLIMVVGPIIALVLSAYELVLAVASGEDDAKKKAFKKVRGRVIAAVLLLIVPYIITLVLNIVNNQFGNCL